MKKTLLVLLSLAALAAFVGCSNSAGSSGSSGNSSSGGPDLSGVTDTSASWTQQDCWIELNKSGNSYTYPTCTTEDKTEEAKNNTQDHLWRKGTQWTLSNPGFTKITSITAYENGNFNTAKGTLTPNYTLTDTQHNVHNGLFAWKDASKAYIAMQEKHHIPPRQNGDRNRIIFIFDNNTKLELFY